MAGAAESSIPDRDGGTIRFGILCDGSEVQPWQVRCLEQLCDAPLAQGVVRIFTSATRCAGLPTRLAALPDIALLQPDCATADAAAVARVRESRLDFVLCLAGSCPPELLDVCRYGVWKYHFGDWSSEPDGPIGFWDAYEGNTFSTALLVRLQPAADTAIILRDGHLRTNRLSPTGNQRQLLNRFTHWPAQLCADIANGVVDRLSGPPVRAKRSSRGWPNRWQSLDWQRRRLTRAAGAGWRSLFRHEQWNVGIIQQPIADFLQGRRAAVHWLPATRSAEYRADPFGVERDGKLTIFCEHYRYGEGRGFIVALGADAADAAQTVTIGPQPPVHLSYPYMVQVQDRLLCLPESSEADEVVWYELEQFPTRWIRGKAVLSGTAIVDATVFFHDQHWWLAGSEVAPKGANCELHLWFAPTLDGPWQPHPGNPVKIDVRSSRPAGTPFLVDGVLYRPSQDCSETYGGQVTINRVLTLTPTAFREEIAATVAPDATGKYPDGLHTLSQVGDLTLIDGRRRVFVPTELFRVLRKAARQLMGH